MKKGEGPGSFGKWKSVYVVETQDYNLDIYKDEKVVFYSKSLRLRTTM